MNTIDGRCHCQRCTDRTGDIYRMVGYCKNCGASDILMLFRAGDKTRDLDCPLCGVWMSVHPLRLATEDEVPVDE